LKFWYQTDNTGGWTSLQASAVNTSTLASTNVGSSVLSATVTSQTTWALYQGSFTPGTTGTYTFNVTAANNGAPWWLALDDFSVVGPCSAPTNQPTSFAATNLNATG
jgi:hypothetical protein